MNTRDIANHIRKFVAISEDMEKELNKFFLVKKYKKNEYLLRLGNNVSFDFFIIKGCVRVFTLDDNGVEHNIVFASENWWTGDFAGFYKGLPACVSVQALEPCEVLALSKTNKDKLIQIFPELLTYFYELFQNAIIAQQDRIVQSLSFTAEKRYQLFLQNYPNLAHRISQKHIASYLGITPEFLSMIRAKIAKK